MSKQASQSPETTDKPFELTPEELQRIDDAIRSYGSVCSRQGGACNNYMEKTRHKLVNQIEAIINEGRQTC